jgi:hypothetical protein
LREIRVMQVFSIALMLHQHLYADGSEANSPVAAQRQSTDAGRPLGDLLERHLRRRG